MTQVPKSALKSRRLALCISQIGGLGRRRIYRRMENSFKDDEAKADGLAMTETEPK